MLSSSLAPLTSFRDMARGSFIRADASPCATTIDKDGVIRPVASGRLRSCWADTDGDGIRDTIGWLLEASRANEWTKSRAQNDAAWTRVNLTPTANNVTGPWNTVTATKLTEDAVNGHHYIERSWAGAADNTQQAFVFQIKPNGRQWYRILTQNKAGTVAHSWFDLVNGVVGTLAGTHKIRLERLFTGFWRVEFVLSSSGSGATTPLIDVVSALADNSTATFTGDGTTGWWAEGFQWEKDAAFPSSFIPSDGSILSRAEEIWRPGCFAAPDQDITSLIRFVKPTWLSFFDPVIAPGLAALGESQEPALNLGLYFAGNPPNISAQIRQSAQQFAAGSITNPSTAIITLCTQFRNLTTAGTCRVDAGTGSGFGADSTPAAPAIPFFGTQWVRVGSRHGNSAHCAFTIITDVMVAAGQFTKPEMEAALPV